MSNELNGFVIPKTYPSFLNYFSTTSFAIALKVSFSGRKGIFLFMERVQISPCGFLANARIDNVSEFQVKNWGSLSLRHRKPIF